NANQDHLLRQFGGIVPELAARNHLVKLNAQLNDLFQRSQFSLEQLDMVGVTAYPGLLGPLLTGMNMAKTLALLGELPINPVNHLLAHLEAIHLTEKIKYPYVGLLVSGGHSAFFLMKGPVEYSLLGSTIDDAAGEAFDKGGKLLGLAYPAGKLIDQL